MGSANVAMDLFNDSPPRAGHISGIDRKMIACTKYHLSMRTWLFELLLSQPRFLIGQGPASQVVQDRGYPRVGGLILGCVYFRIMNRRMGH